MPRQRSTPSLTSGSAALLVEPLVGSTVPRIYTPPLVTGPPGPCGCGCALTPESSDGFAQVEFALDVLGRPLDPWQRWLAIHAGELLPDGRPRFRHVLAVVARQNGKSEIPVILSLFWMFVDGLPTVLWTSTQLKYADRAADKIERYARKSEALRDLIPARKWKRNVLGSSVLAYDDCEFVTATANGEGGRSMTVHRLVQDELREHRDYDAWGAAVPAMSAVPDAQAWHLSNAGEDHSVVLNEQQNAARLAITEGDTSTNVGLFEWSAPDGSDPEDVVALLSANPGCGFHGPSLDELLGEARTAKRAGGQALAKFLTEKMCVRVRHLNPAIDPTAWAACLDPGDLAGVRSRIALCLDVSLDAQHATLTAAGRLGDGRIRVEPVAAWSGPSCTLDLARDLPGLVAKVKPKILGWFPGGPAASLATDLAKRRGWPPPGVKVEAIRQDVAAVCMGLAKAVLGGNVAHSADALQDAHVEAAERLVTGDTWRFTRKGVGHCDAAYAAAGAVHLASLLPARHRLSTVISIPV